MEAWVLIAIVIAAMLCASATFYARHVSRGETRDERRQWMWWGGIPNIYAVGTILEKHAKRGNKMARLAKGAHYLGIAIAPLVLAFLGLRDYLSR